ncbi:unnamed protein product [Cunninghamella echinulata]
MARKIFKTIDVDIDAGTHNDKLYTAALHPWRSWLRRQMLPLVRKETPWIAAMQKRIRTPFFDHYFLWTANLGTHTFFMVFLPILIWFGNAQLGRSIACLAAFGVFWSGFFKDFMCLPRPLSPPVHRLTMSIGAAFEYGFPSTHTTNSVSVALYLIAVACDTFAPESPIRMFCILGAMFYAFSVVFGRIYCGMHSVTDVVGGAILAYILYWFQWTFREALDSFVTDDSYWIFLTIPICLIFVGIHPDPIERCPCFEDSVCFMGVVMGIYPGSWICYRSEICQLGLKSSALTSSFDLKDIALTLMKITIGVALLFIWRMACKKVCYFILPPIYRAFNLPHRKFEIGARTYKSLNKESIHPIPSVLDLRGLAKSVSDAEHVGIQSGIDLHERRVAECKNRRKENNTFLDEKEVHSHSAPSTPPVSSSLYDDNTLSMLIVEDAPLRYDVDIVTKLIVYAGIGLMAVFPAPVLFQLIFE